MIPNASRIDALIEQAREAGPHDKEDARGRLVAELIDSLDFKVKGSVAGTLFGPNVPSDKREHVAACLLRLLCADPDLFWDWGSQERRKGLELIRQQMPAVCKAQGVKEGEDLDTHELWGQLAGAEARVLDRFNGVIDSMSNIDTALNTKGSLLQALRHPASAELLVPFLPAAALANDPVSYIYDRAGEFVDAPGHRKLAVYRAAKEALEGLADAVAKSPTRYAELALLRPLGTLVGLLEAELGASGAVRPGALTLRASDWKYPLHEPGRDIEIKLEVENTSGGHSESVELTLSSEDEALAFGANPFTTALPNVQIGRTDVYVTGSVQDPCRGGAVSIRYRLTWTNFDGSEGEDTGSVQLLPQRADLDWDELRRLRPYSLEAVEEEEDLVGRSLLIESLYAKLTAKRIESAIVWGQKRVGKTSIAQTIQAKLDTLSDTATAYIVTNDVTKTTAERFVEELGDGIVEQLLDHPVLDGLGFEPPTFDASLAPLIMWLRRIDRAELGVRVVVIVDEFDELPEELLAYSPMNDTFFGNLRGLSKPRNVGFVLVGGENVRDVREHSAQDRLNKFSNYKVDYFGDDAWHDFTELVQRPTEGVLEFSPDALRALHTATDGNPFYTKLLCGNLYARAHQARDSFVRFEDVERVVSDTIKGEDSSLEGLSINNVIHFWTDGIPYADRERRDEIQTLRRKFLLAFADAEQRDGWVQLQDIRSSEMIGDPAQAKELEESFVTRQVLIREGNRGRLRPRLFQRWLVEVGADRISSKYHDKAAVEAVRRRREADRVKDGEILDALERWGSSLYRGGRIELAHVRRWLDQFSTPRDRRLMFRLVERFALVSRAALESHLAAVHERVKTRRFVEEGEVARRDLAVSALGEFSKSGPSVARLYRQRNGVYAGHVVAPERIVPLVEGQSRIRAVVFVDDVIGSGRQAARAFDDFRHAPVEGFETAQAFLADRDVKVYITATHGLENGVNHLQRVSERAKQESGLQVEVHVSQMLESRDQAFDPEAGIFDSDADREHAQHIASQYGRQLVGSQNELGYGRSQLLLSFDDNCPNNTLPIFWSSKGDWKPLFERQA